MLMVHAPQGLRPKIWYEEHRTLAGSPKFYLHALIEISTLHPPKTRVLHLNEPSGMPKKRALDPRKADKTSGNTQPHRESARPHGHAAQVHPQINRRKIHCGELSAES